MSLAKPMMTVLGFLNPNGHVSFPSPLLTIVSKEEDSDIYCINSRTHLAKMVNDNGPSKLEGLSARPEFIAASTKKPIQSNDVNLLTSFGFAADNIAVGTPEELLHRLDLAITCDQSTGEELAKLENELEVWRKLVAERKLSL